MTEMPGWSEFQNALSQLAAASGGGGTSGGGGGGGGGGAGAFPVNARGEVIDPVDEAGQFSRWVPQNQVRDWGPFGYQGQQGYTGVDDSGRQVDLVDEADQAHRFQGIGDQNVYSNPAG